MPSGSPSTPGVRKYRYGETDEEDQVGIVTGLAYTEFGGDILTIEAVKMPGKGRMSITGNLKDVMKESISAAASYRPLARHRASASPRRMFEKTDVHVHVPEGATPKDGPSAGVAMAVAIISVLTGMPIRKDLAMTGEITLRGRVLPIGGLKEKLLAALRSGIKTVLIPAENEKDLAEVPENVKSGPGDHPGRHRRRGAGPGADRSADPDRVESRKDAEPVLGRRRGRRGRLRRGLAAGSQPGRGPSAAGPAGGARPGLKRRPSLIEEKCAAREQSRAVVI